ncbi:MAG: aspartate carbamoyltransferase catalytic subunit [Candidatus Omnitrophota bacterium]
MHLLGLKGMGRREIEAILDSARAFKEVSARKIKKVPALRGKTVVLFFWEPSTRTRISFELAAKRLSADTLNMSSAESSMVKGESAIDTARNIQAMNVDIIVVRHSSAGLPYLLSRAIDVSVINAGDGCNEHPTQGLLDLFTIREKKGRISRLSVCIIGDIAHSRVARSNIYGLKAMGAEVSICAPPTLIPRDVDDLGVGVFLSLDEAIKRADVINVLRLQFERQREPGREIPDINEYRRLFGIDKQRLRRAKNDLLILHPGPVNRGIELSPEVADGKNSVILEQVTNGVAVRMAVLYLVSRGSKQSPNPES